MPTSESPPAISAVDVNRRLAEIRSRIEAVSARAVSVLAVTKAFGVDAVLAAREVGLDAVGENYANELIAKVADPQVPPSTQWHFIGRLQSNKVKELAPHVKVWQSVDRLKVATLIARHAPGAVVYAQMRPRQLGSDADKGGCPIDEFPGFVASMRDLGLNVDGIMTVGVLGDRDASAAAFADAATLADRLDLEHRSMGMTDDLEMAVRSGSTMIRIGSGLFGDRPNRASTLGVR